ncbi:MAG TPA: HAMP domain-containing sensor histidine kinase [Longimicrobiales bacterium]|nr:HAMP domain-containing sensor histidine kinase [Longimicrobiales bacterium]
MAFFRIRSFQGRIFLAILLVVLVPMALAVAGGVVTLRDLGTRSGTLGAWDAVAQSGHRLLDEVDRVESTDAGLRVAATEHRNALSESVRMSRLYVFVAQRVLSVLPLAAVFAGLLLATVAFFAARRLSRGFGGPIAELAGWTERIARGEALPPEGAGASSVQELSTLRVALRRMADELDTARRREIENVRMRSWTDLARKVAHEIKNPLTPMRMAATTLTRGREGAEAEAGNILLEEIQRLDEMARTFSQYGRLPEGPRSLVDLRELMEGLASQHGSDTVPVRVTGEATMVDAHYDALERAFRNLLVNAVEAQESGGSVDVSVSHADGMAHVFVEDRGPGVPPELKNEIWNPDVTTKHRGTGLGLAIVRQTMMHHGGSVDVHDRSGGGASFRVSLPTANQDAS